jgi:hypothetical protein
VALLVMYIPIVADDLPVLLEVTLNHTSMKSLSPVLKAWAEKLVAGNV